MEAMKPRSRIGRVLRVLSAAAGALVMFYLFVGYIVRPWLGSWGATMAEQRRALPGDDLVPNAATQTTLAIDIDAPPEKVWPWLVQMGVDRAGLYTYTWIENGLLGLSVENADRIHPEWQDLRPGDLLAFTPADYPTGRTGPLTTAVEKNRALVFCGGPDPQHCRSTLQFFLEALPDGTTRLLFRGRANERLSLLARLPDLLLEPGYLVMERKMLLGIKSRAEQS